MYSLNCREGSSFTHCKLNFRLYSRIFLSHATLHFELFSGRMVLLLFYIDLFDMYGYKLLSERTLNNM